MKGADSAKIIGPDLQMLEKIADQVVHEMGAISGVEDLGVFHVPGRPKYNIVVDRELAARYGLKLRPTRSMPTNRRA